MSMDMGRAVGQRAYGASEGEEVVERTYGAAGAEIEERHGRCEAENQSPFPKYVSIAAQEESRKGVRNAVRAMMSLGH